MSKVLEGQVEDYLVAQIKMLGGRSFKWVSPGVRGVPDRICIVPVNGEATYYLVECKSPYGKLSNSQLHMLTALRDTYGCSCYVVGCEADVDTLIQLIRGRMNSDVDTLIQLIRGRMNNADT